MKSLRVKTNVVYSHLEECATRVIVEQGGTRSGKTFNILTWIIFGYCLQQTGKVVTIVRQTLPSLRATAMRDFFQILEEYNLYDETKHNKTNFEYILNGNLVEFVPCDSSQKIRGRRRNFLFANEANELSKETWRQLAMRTSGEDGRPALCLDFNPSDAYHWIYTEILDRPDCTFHQTTYLDNPFLDQSVVDEIERLRDADPDYWRVYGLGERALLSNAVFGHYKELDGVPATAKLVAYGLDFGYSVDPSACVAVYEYEKGYLVDEMFYSSNMTNADLAREMRAQGIGKYDRVVADSAEPKTIDQLHGAGFNIHPCVKGADSVRAGIDQMRSKPLFVTSRSVNAIKEMRNYRWAEDKNGNPINKPEGVDHILDATRYVVMWNERNPTYGQYALG